MRLTGWKLFFLASCFAIEISSQDYMPYSGNVTYDGRRKNLFLPKRFSGNLNNADSLFKNNASMKNGPGVFLLGLEEINNADREKRETVKNVIPVCLFIVEANRKKRNGKNDNSPILFKNIKPINTKKLIKGPTSNSYSQEFFKEPPISHKLNSADKVNILREATRTLEEISQLNKYDTGDMPDDMKRPLISVLFEKISNLYADKRRIDTK